MNKTILCSCKEYYEKCKEKYCLNNKQEKLSYNIYDYSILEFQRENENNKNNDFFQFDEEYDKCIELLSRQLNTTLHRYGTKTRYATQCQIKDFPRNADFQHSLNIILEKIARKIEKHIHKCYINCNHIIYYRSFSVSETKVDNNTSWQWHKDGHPNQYYKILLYLSDVNMNNGPFSYITDKDGNAIRLPSNHKYVFKNGEKDNNFLLKDNSIPYSDQACSRIPLNYIEHLKTQGYLEKQFVGKKGSFIVFNENIIHRASFCRKKHRDAIVFTFRPNLTRVNNYYTDSAAINGVAFHHWT